MERYISIDNAIKIVTKAMEGGEYHRLIDVSNALKEATVADVVPKEEADEWYHEYHVIKDALKTEKMYHRETEKLADKYFVECKHLQEMLDAAIAGQESLQRYLEREGEWEMQKFPLTKCSVCGYVRNCEKDKGWKFCPECGAKMK